MAQTITAVGIPSKESFPSVTADSDITADSAAVDASGAPSPSLLVNHALQAAGLTSAEVFGPPVVRASWGVTLTGVPSGEAFGSTAVVVTSLVIEPSGLPPTEVFGTALLSTGVVAEGAPSAGVFGDPPVLGLGLAQTGIPTEEGFGTAAFTTSIVAEGVISEEGVGTALLVADLSAGGVSSEEVFGDIASITVGHVLPMTGLPSVAEVGSAGVQMGAAVAGIMSEEAVSSPWVATWGVPYTASRISMKDLTKRAGMKNLTKRHGISQRVR